MTDSRSAFYARDGKEADWEEAVRMSGGHDPGPGVCAALVMTVDGAALLMANPAAEGCEEPDHICLQAVELIDAFREEGPRAPWNRLPDGGHISALVNPQKV